MAGTRSRWSHSILEMLSQRIYGLALGYEDVNDDEQLRKDPVFGVLTESFAHEAAVDRFAQAYQPPASKLERCHRQRGTCGKVRQKVSTDCGLFGSELRTPLASCSPALGSVMRDTVVRRGEVRLYAFQ